MENIQEFTAFMTVVIAATWFFIKWRSDAYWHKYFRDKLIEEESYNRILIRELGKLAKGPKSAVNRKRKTQKK